MLLVTGFGPFGDIIDNPSARVARAIEGWRVRGETVVTRVLPVSYARAPAEVIALATYLRPRLVLGLGVAATRSGVEVERRGLRAGGEAVDVDGLGWEPGAGPDVLASTLDVAKLAGALGAEESDHAGAYVCNAWLYEVTRALSVPVGFVHVPLAGIEPPRLAAGLATLLA